MNIHMRLETTADRYAVEAMTREAFWRFWEGGLRICDEHLLVHKLRGAEGFVPELNTVAEIDGKIAGHIIFTKSRVEDDSGKTYGTLTFGPLTVLPEFQGKGIGRALMKHTFDTAAGMGFRAVIIFGHPDYYPRAGFRRAAEFGITAPDGKTFDALMAYPLYDGALDGISGRYFIDPVYERLNQEETLEFDKRFPAKEPHIPIPLSVLLERLEHGAAEAVKRQGFSTFEEIRSRSEREIMSIEGVDEKTLETIRRLMRENGRDWGKQGG